jgi:hypothetical protein
LSPWGVCSSRSDYMMSELSWKILITRGQWAVGTAHAAIRQWPTTHSQSLRPHWLVKDTLMDNLLSSTIVCG